MLAYTNALVTSIISCRQDEPKNKDRIYKKSIEEFCNKYDGAKEFVDNRIKELCVQDGIVINEVCACLKLIYFCIENSFFVLKVIL